ncbi:hypothetical protein CEXT_76071, partial [Caerostris extrusa]
SSPGIGNPVAVLLLAFRSLFYRVDAVHHLFMKDRSSRCRVRSPGQSNVF